MDVPPPRVRRFSSAIGDDAIRFGDGILVAAAFGNETSGTMSAYPSFFHAVARADLPAAYAEVWVVLSGALRVGAGSDAVTVGAGDFVHAPEQAPGVVEALENTTLGCVQLPRFSPVLRLCCAG